MRRLVPVIAVAVFGLVGAAMAEEDPVRINVKEDLIEISASQTQWYLSHGWATTFLALTSGMGEAELKEFLMAHWLFELEVDGEFVAANGVELSEWTPPGEEPVWVVSWSYTAPFGPGIHILEGTWSIRALPCRYVNACVDGHGCDPQFTVCECTFVDGLITHRHSHTLTLVVLP